MRRALRGSLLALLLPLAATAQAAQSPDDARRRLEQTERDRAAALAAQQTAAAQAAARAADAARLSDQLAAATARLSRAEQATAAAKARMQTLTQARSEAEDRLAAHARKLAPLLPLVERLSLYPTQTVLALPLPPKAAIRGVLVMQEIARQIAAEAAALRQQQAALTAAAQAAADEAPKLAGAQAAQAAAAADLDRQLAAANTDRRAAEQDEAAAAARAAELAERAASLRDLLAQLEKARDARQHAAAAPQHPPTHGHGSAGGERLALLTPVAGRVVQRWGVPTDAGPAAGISYRAASAARVAAPCAGTVMFAAPFRSYGNLLIIDCGGGFDAVLAGFSRLEVGTGQTVRRGAPVGVLPAGGGSAGDNPALYVELRRDGEPVDPTPWFKARG